MEKSGNRIILRGNPWRIPSEARAFEGMIAGRPTKTQRADRLRQVRAAREAWKPSADAMALVDRMRTMVGKRICMQIWDPIMELLEDEGPFPIAGICMEVTVREDGGFHQAFINLSEASERITSHGYAALARFSAQSSPGCVAIPLAEISAIWMV